VRFSCAAGINQHGGSHFTMNKRLLIVPSLSSLRRPWRLTWTPSLSSRLPQRRTAFSDDFQSAVHDKRWHKVVDTFAFENGALKGTQTREKDMPSPMASPSSRRTRQSMGWNSPQRTASWSAGSALKAHGMIDSSSMIANSPDPTYGHLCRAQVRLNKVTILDERDGSQSNALIELRKDPVKTKPRSANGSPRIAPVSREIGGGQMVYPVVETVSEEMRVTIDGKPAGYLKSPASAMKPSPRSSWASAARMAGLTTSKSGNADRPNEANGRPVGR